MIRNYFNRPVVLVLSLCISLAVAGCGGGGSSDMPDIGKVSGSVKLDGQPLPKAQIQFSPKGGRPSQAITDSSGNYELQYIDSPGAKVGEHLVTITTHIPASEDEGTPAVPEKVPAKYNMKAHENPEMTKTVKQGDNTIDFDLSTEGEEVVQPDSGTEGSCTDSCS